MSENIINRARAAHWRDVCNEYLETFCKKHEYTYGPDMWIGNDPGTIACVNEEMMVSMDTIRYDIDNDIPEEYFTKWYWKGLDVYEVTGEHYMNYESFCKGAPDKWTTEELENLRKKLNNKDNETGNI